MIEVESVLKVLDNSGALTVKCIKVLGGKTAHVNSYIVVAVQSAVPNEKIKKGDIYKALLVTTKSPIKRLDGTSIRFGTNGVILLNSNLEMMGTRLFSPIPAEVRLRSPKAASLAPEVL